MGYTHYYDQKEEVTDSQWERITTDFQKLYRFYPGFPPIQFNDDDARPPAITSKWILFNGVGEDGHETFYIARDGTPPYWCYCKTNAKPYDLAVTACLLLMHYHAPGVWAISSDGDSDDWAEALAMVRSLYPDARLPEVIETS